LHCLGAWHCLRGRMVAAAAMAGSGLHAADAAAADADAAAAATAAKGGAPTPTLCDGPRRSRAGDRAGGGSGASGCRADAA
jgi:hypothetical protein